LNAFEDAFKVLSKIIKSGKKIENSLIGKPCLPFFTRVADFNAAALNAKD